MEMENSVKNVYKRGVYLLDSQAAYSR